MSRDWKLCLWGMCGAWCGMAAVRQEWGVLLFFAVIGLASKVWAGDAA